MTKIKAKNDMSYGMRGGYVWVWVISHIAFWVVMWLPLDIRQHLLYYWGRNTADGSSPVIILFTTLVMALLQGRVIKRVFNQSMPGWMLTNLIGALLSIGAFATTPSTNLYVWVLSLMLPIAFVQTAWLNRSVKSAWLWFVASFVGALFFAFPLSNNNYSQGSFALIPWMLGIGLSQGIIQAVVMRYLWMHSRDEEKAKQQPAEDIMNDQMAAARLSLNETTEDIIDEDSLSKQLTR